MFFRLHFVVTKFELVLRILLGIHSPEKVDVDKLESNCLKCNEAMQVLNMIRRVL